MLNQESVDQDKYSFLFELSCNDKSQKWDQPIKCETPKSDETSLAGYNQEIQTRVEESFKIAQIPNNCFDSWKIETRVRIAMLSL